ncbi:MAG: N-6 DNA methylase [Actinomycetota bacterium]|nr:N-6 DNA methylase [Actinomycetota bacterium]
MQALSQVEVPDRRSNLKAWQKRNGVHYTPSDLATFVARRLLAQVKEPPVTVLDPACGDGELLLALVQEVRNQGRPEPRLIGVDRDGDAVDTARDRLEAAGGKIVTLHCADFLECGDEIVNREGGCDAIISNPPYVRTQALGGSRARSLADQFDLKGRVDLYHAFAAAMTRAIRPGGVLGLLCSNRFLLTKGGESMRELFLRHYEIEELWDLGDTKLFGAAVLPAIVVARREASRRRNGSTYVRVYEDASERAASQQKSVVSALEAGVVGDIQVNERHFRIERGVLAESASNRPWRLTSPGGSRWLKQVRERASGCLADLGPIRVGVKTTADAVFIRSGWEDLPPQHRPEDELIYPLLTHRLAQPWVARNDADGRRYILYPHEVRDGRRCPVDLKRFPRAKAYLEQHRERLEGRQYVRKAGRSWYEIWVPQQPDAWTKQKIVWPDISDRPRFFLDKTGSIVNGDCYWLSCGDASREDVALALAVANSNFALRYYDICFGNRLYGGRRRFITQYLEELPIPAASRDQLRDITTMVTDLMKVGKTGSEAKVTEAALDDAVAELFGVKEVGRQS